MVATPIHNGASIIHLIEVFTFGRSVMVADCLRRGMSIASDVKEFGVSFVMVGMVINGSHVLCPLVPFALSLGWRFPGPL